MLIKNKIFLRKRKISAFWQKNTAKTRHFGQITALDENHGFRDFRDYLLSLLIHVGPTCFLEDGPT